MDIIYRSILSVDEFDKDLLLKIKKIANFTRKFANNDLNINVKRVNYNNKYDGRFLAMAFYKTCHIIVFMLSTINNAFAYNNRFQNKNFEDIIIKFIIKAVLHECRHIWQFKTEYGLSINLESMEQHQIDFKENFDRFIKMTKLMELDARKYATKKYYNVMKELKKYNIL